MDQFSLHTRLTICFVGRSGCGKGTQAQFLLNRLTPEGVFHLETGRFIRELLALKNPTTEIARTTINEKGKLFPWWFPMFLWLREMIERGRADTHIIGDGTPRRVVEAKFLDELLSWHERPLPLCVYIDIPEEEAVRRLLVRAGGRTDDTIEGIRSRMQFFYEDVMPVVDYYEEHGRLISVDGSVPPEEVWRHIDRMLGERLGDQWPRDNDTHAT